MADIVLLFVLKGRDCMSKVLIEVLVIILIAGSYLILYSAVRVSAISDQRIAEITHQSKNCRMFWHFRIMFFNMTIDSLQLEMNDWKCLTVRWKMRTSICSL